MFTGGCKHANRAQHSNVYAQRLMNTGQNGIYKHVNIFLYEMINTREIRGVCTLDTPECV